MKRNNLKGFTLIEVIIAVFLMSIISLGLIKSLLSISTIMEKQKLRKEMIDIAENVIELAMSGDNNTFSKKGFVIECKIKPLEDEFSHIEVEITHEETNDKISLQNYF